MERLYQAADLQQAHLLLHRLQARGIAARVLNENAQGALGEIPFTHAWPEVWILEPRDRALAEQVVTEFENGPAAGPPWLCRACGERNPGEFELCWACGRARESEEP